MAKHVHIYLHTRDAEGPAHAPAGSSKGGQFVSGGGGGSSGGSKAKSSGGSSGKKEPAKNLPSKSSGPGGLEVYNLHAAAGGELVQVRITNKAQYEWAQKNLGLKGSGAGMGSYNLSSSQTKQLKEHMGRHASSASSTGGKLPKVGEHIGQYTGASQKTASPAPSSKAGPVNQSSGPDEDKLRARVKAAREGMQAAGKNKAEYERHESQFESSMEALTALQEKNKAAGKK